MVTVLRFELVQIWIIQEEVWLNRRVLYREWDVTLQSLVFVRTSLAGLAARFCFKINRINNSPFCKLTQIVTYFEIHIILNNGFYLGETDKNSGNSVALIQYSPENV